MPDLRVPFRIDYLKKEIDLYETIYPALRNQLDKLYQPFNAMLAQSEELLADYAIEHHADSPDTAPASPYFHRLMLIKGELLHIEHFYNKIKAQFLLVEEFIPAFPDKLLACKDPFSDKDYASNKFGTLSTEWNALKVSINNFSGSVYKLKLTLEMLKDEFSSLNKD